MNAAVAFFISGLVPEFLMRFLAWLLIHTFHRVDKSGLENIPDEGRLHRRLQPRALRGRGSSSPRASAGRALRDGSPHLPRSGAVVHLSHDAHKILIASAKEDPQMKDRAFAEAAEALEAGEIVGIFPRAS